MDWGLVITIIGTGIGLAAFLNQIIRNLKADVQASFDRIDKNFEKHEQRFEQLDQRLFLLCMGKDLASILKAEREKKE
jgi:hypothetical protein